MSLEESLARRLAAEIESELDAMVQLVRESANAPRGGDIYARRARGSILHDFYNGAERIFERIAAELNGGVPNVANWHQQLVADMALAIPNCGRRSSTTTSATAWRSTAGSATCSATSTARCSTMCAYATSRNGCRGPWKTFKPKSARSQPGSSAPEGLVLQPG